MNDAAWPHLPLGELAAPDPRAIAIGPFGSRMRADTYVASGIPVVRGNNITQSRRPSGSFVYVTEELAESMPGCILRPGDLVFPHRGAIGEVGLIEGPPDTRFMLSTSLMKLTPDRTRLDPMFAYYYFFSVLGRAELMMRASTVGTPGIGQPLASLRSIPVPLPPLAEQRKIARTLAALDDKIESNSRAVSLQRDLAIALLNEAAETEIQLRDVAQIRKGISYKGEGLAQPGFGVPMVNMGNAENYGWLKRSGTKYYSGDHRPRHLAPAGSLLITGVEQTWKNEIIGWPLLVPPDMGTVLFTHHMLLVDFVGDCEWMRLPVWAQLFTAASRATLEALIYGTTVATLPVAEVGSLCVKVAGRASPAIPAAEALLQRSWQLELESKSLAELRDALLPALLTGQLRLTSTSDLAVVRGSADGEG